MRTNVVDLTKYVGLAVLLIVLVVGPLFMRPYYLHMLIVVLISVVLAVSYRFITLMGGWSLGHVAFMGIGAYASAKLTTSLGWPFWLSFPVAALITALVAMVLAVPCLKGRGIYFLLLTFATWGLVDQVWRRVGIFAGTSGIGGIPSIFPGVGYYFVILIVTLLTLMTLYRLEKSRIGDTLKCIALDESLAESVGIHTYRYRLLAFVVGNSFAGVAGVLYAHQMGAIAPSDFTSLRMAEIFIYVLVGGTITIAGPIMGVVVFTAIKLLFEGLLQFYPLLIGAVVIITLVVLPGGLAALAQRVLAWAGKACRKEVPSENQ